MQCVIDLTQETTALAGQLRELANKLNRAVNVLQDRDPTSAQPQTDIRLGDRLNDILDDIEAAREHLKQFSEAITAL